MAVGMMETAHSNTVHAAESREGEWGPVRFSSDVENERAGAGRDKNQTRENPNREVHFSCSADNK